MKLEAMLAHDAGWCALLQRAAKSWPRWVSDDAHLGVVAASDDLPEWLLTADPIEADVVLQALAARGSTEGADDLAAAALLVGCLLPGAGMVAAHMSRQWDGVQGDCQRPWDTPRASVVAAVVVAQLWMEVRALPARGSRWVATSVLRSVRAAVWCELGAIGQLERGQRMRLLTELVGTTAELPLPNPDLTPPQPWAADPALSIEDDGAAEVAELLAWARGENVIDGDDGELLIELLIEAHRSEIHHAKGRGGLSSLALSQRVADHHGCSSATIRRRVARSIAALSGAAPEYLARDERRTSTSTTASTEVSPR